MTNKPELLSIGDITEKKGEIVRGKVKLLDLPTDDQVNLAVIIASGAEKGPTILLTGNIHGDEVTGVIVLHRFLESLDLTKLKGRFVVFPSLNPTGHLAHTRYPQFEAKDPNRSWPEYRPESVKPEDVNDTSDYMYPIQKRMDDHPTRLESAFKSIAQIFKNIQCDYHCDLHTFSTLSIPFVFLDRVLYESDEEEARHLFDRTHEMVKALGLTVVLERSARIYVKDKLHRSTSGYTLNCLRVPSCTIEMGPMNDVLPTARDATLTALDNLMIWAGMTGDDTKKIKPITQVPVIHFEKIHRYLEYPQVLETGIVDYQKDAGDAFKEGETIAIVRSMDGVCKSKIVAEFDGYVIAWYPGIAKYKGDVLGMVAVEDKDAASIVRWNSLPSSVFK